MKLSSGVEWALHCAVLLAATPEGTGIPGHRLARYYDLPEAYLAKQLQLVVRAGLLAASPGPRGGFRLARPADRITVLDVVQAIEGDQPAFRCQEIRRHGSGAAPPAEWVNPCGIATVMGSADRAWQRELDAVSVADLARRSPATARKRVRAWAAE